jgi:hypothetical protein
VLAVVENEQHPARTQRRGQQIDRCCHPVAGADLQDAEDQLRHCLGGRARLECGEHDQPGAVGVADRIGAARDLEGQPRLADAAGAGERDEPFPPEQRAELRDRLGAADHIGHGYGQVRPHPRRRRGERRRLLQHRLRHGSELGARIDAELVAEPPAQVVVAVERVALPARRVQRADVEGTQPFPQRVLGDQVGEFRRERAVLAERESRLGELF